MITIEKEEYKDYHGIDLDLELEGLDDESNKAERTILLWTKRVYKEMRKLSTKPIPTDDKLTDIQVVAIKEAILEYGAYYLKNGDLHHQSGFSEDKGQIIQRDELDKLLFPDEIVDSLRKVGLITRNFGRTSYYGDLY